jgi:STE24 endopeptidase
MNVDKASRFQRLQRRCVWLSLAVHGILMLALTAGGMARPLRDAAVFVAHASVVSTWTVAIFSVLLFILFEVASFPLRFYQTFIVERRYGLSSVSPRAWLTDHAKGVAIGGLLAVAAAQVVYFTLGRWPRAWWIVSAAAFIAAVIVLARVTPVLLLPLFYRFKPLDRAALRSRLEALSVKAGVPVLGVYEWGLGDKTRRANAALVGTGRSRRILVSDTLLAQYTDDEIEVILAHELGHYAHRDIRTGLLLEAFLMVAMFGAAAAALHQFWPRLGLTSPADPAGLPLLLLAGAMVSLFSRPALNALSRRHEHRADRFALRLTERPDAFVSAMRRLAAQNLAEVRPSTTTLWLFHTHPPFEQRIQAAKAPGLMGSDPTTPFAPS